MNRRFETFCGIPENFNKGFGEQFDLVRYE